MAWSSILPDHLSSFETWIARLFIFFGVVTIGPWAVLILYDLALYFFRTVAYELPVFGGRAMGKRRPRAPSLTERPDGQRRQFNPMLHPGDEANAHASGTSRAVGSDASIQFRNTAKEDS
ncbi:hypothetical protein DIS24_g2062 [Lasiodiplodia hormozganensis]|uniref:Uncharacterized protein n=1 Tax=Lasiodiplodia hormozganensis TaxID=869390 RepID=A0AA40D3Z5_9PEZI|nr:hypothetical protein DIS24_g2062 [Lasiodiplodia hormozganensis]